MSNGQPVVNRWVVLPLALVAVVLLLNIGATGFEKAGIPRAAVPFVLSASLAGSLVNIPVWVRDLRTPLEVGVRGAIVYYRPPRIAHQVIAVNVGGAVVPVLVSLYLADNAAAWKLILAITTMALFTRRVSRVVPGKGVVLPALLPPLLAAALGLLLGIGGPPGEATVIAYASGALGTLIGADLLHFGRLRDVGPGVSSIGGAGVFDGVFLAGLVAALLS